MAVNTFSTSIQSLFDGMNTVLSTKTVVGEPITVNDTIIIPLVDVHFGMGAGSMASDAKKKDSAGGGIGCDMDPCAVLVIRGDVVKVIPVESHQSPFMKLIDMVPDIMDRFTKGDPMEDEKVAEKVSEIVEDK
ncbi:GerW family sporulation protein [Frisingicoccus sp.]|uniref:GerW family sporulation protein n=1 Tax=Frisingicoccus sp. TaxID=1918627 RepID=UPI0025C62F75|nr:spore germination protein GerW family protein [Frisingicoccus sp.]MDD6232645.1 spore germination protein GerW family protein [Frisingicoccus sp.]MDY4835321.1 spore germination protein GerW family protein [Frisingicoccus sp.]MDY4922290.1 spore germination protein GerW family protein [Frisingicoccus sp.]MDY5957212.1 spore germination protein GerW family protein [Frisingicoccus sp.]